MLYILYASDILFFIILIFFILPVATFLVIYLTIKLCNLKKHKEKKDDSEHVRNKR